ncbi:NAD(P)-dependent oxidoreductase [Oerskovia sp. Sa2CUA9]|uniref:NAD(P)-dependent oxidoreductase n=1 Tax=Oerskovia merdavium TaxID=2762227 RepID=A0ABR8U2N7_9CELL|nr:NAD(P)-dependent oxidoreductase [Oerskovia merdavium]
MLGTGTMGTGVTHSLLREGFDVTVWNRTASRAAPLADAGALVAPTAAQAAHGADVVLSILFDTAAVLDVLDAAGPSVGTGAVWVQASTIGREGTALVVERARQLGVTLVEANLLGTKQPAEEGNLAVLAAGDPDVLAGIAPVLDAISAKVVIAGTEVGQGTALKLACNAWLATITAGTAQSIALARAEGIDPHLFLDAIAGGASDSPYAHLKGAEMIAGEFAPQFALDGLRKDIGLISEAAAQAHLDPALLDALSDLYGSAAARGHGSDDIAAVYTAFGTARAPSPASD